MIQNIIREVEASLKWSVVKVPSGWQYEIISSPTRKMHHILCPTISPRPIEYLHELAHASLAERHHLFSTAYLHPEITPEEYKVVMYPFRAASDWYADHLLMVWCPNEEKTEIEKHIGYVNHLAQEKTAIDAQRLYIGALMHAQGVKYCRHNERRVPAVFKPVTQTILAVDPGKPTLKHKQDLVNSLLAHTSQLRIRLAQHEGLDVWQVYTEKKS